MYERFHVHHTLSEDEQYILDNSVPDPAMIEKYVWRVAEKDGEEFLRLYTLYTWSEVVLAGTMHMLDPKKYLKL